MSVDAFKAKLDAMTDKERKKFLRGIFGPELRTLEGEEKDHMWLILQFLDPFDSTNNQQWCTDMYKHNGKEYHVHYIGEGLMIDEVVDDDE